LTYVDQWFRASIVNSETTGSGLHIRGVQVTDGVCIYFMGY